MNRIYVIFLFVFLISQYKSSAQGNQISDTGIRHSFLVSGKFTALIGEDNAVIWKAPGYARDGMVLNNGNVLLSINNEALEYKKNSSEIIWSYKMDSRNKELGTVNRLPNGNTLVVERGGLPRLLEIDKDGKIKVNLPLIPETKMITCKLEWLENYQMEIT